MLASLRDFALAGLRPTTPLQRTIVAALVLKLLVVLSMQAFVAFDGPRTASSDRAIARVIGVEQPQP
ncbi:MULTISPECIES: hypothetical protein [unclassified Bradyrhizobium]|uniref:hypothetical protein n=1 Tax=unclassified Bradyrhizobium TaxID=2631580 RepID=UPI0028E94098|nr:MULTISPECIES: hypothetical protein [unclassified Bradyrhizobium]